MPDYNVLSIFKNFILMSAVISWCLAQVFKLFTGVYKQGIRSISLSELLFSTGGMPSSHSAAVASLFSASVIEYGFNSFAVAVTGVLAIIVMRDASGVRLETGKQAIILKKIVRELFSEDANEVNNGLKELIGHTPSQVFVGAILGLIVPIVMHLIRQAL